MATDKTGKYKILVVDDDPDIITTLRIALEEIGLTVLTASDGLLAIEVAETERPDMIILDLMLPKRGGFQILQRLKGNPTMKGKRPLVCMVTGNEGMRHKEFAERHGVDDYLRKPFAIPRLLEAVHAFIAILDKGIPDAKPPSAK
jgi:CheY-like chemotaxis protein